MRRAVAALARRRTHGPASFSTPPPPPPPPPPPSLLSTLLGGTLLDAPAIASLATHGYLVLDGALEAPADLVSAVRAARPFMRPCASIFVDQASGARGRLEKAGVLEAEPGAGDGALDAAVPALAALRSESAALASLVAALASGAGPAAARGCLPSLGGGGAVKAQAARGVPAGGGDGATLRGGFPLHADADEGLDGRRLTLTLYGAGLGGGGGGELLLYPSLDPSACPVTIPPAPGRAVLFSACRLPHAVAPSVADRACVSVWLGVRARGLPPPPPPTPVGAVLRRLAAAGAGPAEVRRTVLAEPDARRALGRLRFGGLWEASMARAHAPSPALDAALARGRAERAVLAAAFEGAGWRGWGEAGVGEGGDDPPAAWF